MKYSYGSPRVVNEELSEHITAQAPTLGNNYRVTHLNDAVPQLPPTWFGYKHVSPEYYISADTGKNVSLSSITALPGFENAMGNYQWNRMSVNAHGWYFNPVSACYNGSALDLVWTRANSTSKPMPDKDWLSTALGQLTSFIPIPPKGIAPLSVPAGPGSHGIHPPDTGDTPEKSAPGGADTSSMPGVDDDKRIKKIPTKIRHAQDIEWDMTRDELEKFFGFDRAEFERSREKRSLIPYGRLARFLI